MGKRKMHGDTFYQCDYTGFPMRSAYCYMPTWDANGKLVKKGSYCNWESVLAHAAAPENLSTAPELEKIKTHVVGITGTDRMSQAPDYKELYHMKGTMSPSAFHEACTTTEEAIMGVKISSDGEVFECLLTPREGSFHFEDYLHKPYCYTGPPQHFHSMRKKSGGAAKDLTVLYYPSRNTGIPDLPANQVASNVFKMQLHGDVLMVQQSREQSFMPRERYVTYTRTDFVEQFMKKRKRSPIEAPAMSTEDYATAKKQMQDSLSKFEAEVSKDAKTPVEHSNVVKARGNPANFRLMVGDLAKQKKDAMGDPVASPVCQPVGA